MGWIDKLLKILFKKHQLNEDQNLKLFYRKFLFYLKLILMKEKSFVIFSNKKYMRQVTILLIREKKVVSFT
jgi:hypothetical protein